MTDTIFALSSGLPPAGIAVVRVSGFAAAAALSALAGRLPPPRRASYRTLRASDREVLDQALVLWFPGPHTATGEDLAELHLHGGRAVVAAVLAELARQPGLRAAEAGEFTRRAFENGRIDLAQAEGLADLLSAETEGQRRAALLLAEGQLGRLAETWRVQLLTLSALIEAELDLSDEDDVGEARDPRFAPLLAQLMWALDAHLAAPPAERLRDGVRIVLAGPPNAGKSSLFNALVGREAAIVTDIAGTTRDRIEAPVIVDGLPMLFIDTAGLHEGTGDAVEAIGMARTHDALAEGDIILWLGEPKQAPEAALVVAAKSDLRGDAREGLAVSVVRGDGMAALRTELVRRARALLPQPGAVALHARHRAIVVEMSESLARCAQSLDPLIQAEHVRLARATLDRLTGRSGVEDMLDTLFGTFCVGK